MLSKVLTIDGIKEMDVGMTKAIRLHCLDCSGFYEADVKNCELVKCPLHPYRMGASRSDMKKGERNRKKAIQQYCIECMGGKQKEVKYCVSVNCALFNFRRCIKTPNKIMKPPKSEY
jgi:hypothetical protein